MTAVTIKMYEKFAFNCKFTKAKVFSNTNEWESSQDLIIDDSIQNCKLTFFTPRKTRHVNNESLSLRINKMPLLNCVRDLKLIVRLAEDFGGGLQFMMEKRRKDWSSSYYGPIGELIGSDLDNEIEFGVSVEMIFIRDSKESFINDMKKLLPEGQYSDLQIVAKDGGRFNVHKCIISIRSEVLKKFIEADMLEKQTGVIRLKDFDSDVVKELLSFLYTGSCDIEKVPSDLFRLAHFLQITELPDACVKYLKENLSIDNLVEALKLKEYSDAYGLQELKNATDKFVNNRKDVLINSRNFLKYLIDSVNMSNIMLILQLGFEYKKEQLMAKAMNFIKSNQKQLLQIPEYKEYIVSNPNLSLQILEYLADNCSNT